MKNIIVERVIHDGGNRINLRFPYDQDLQLNLAETIRLKKEEKKIETTGRVKTSSSAEFSTLNEKREANRYPKTTVQTYVTMMIKFC